jgi:flagellar capping protein FliD
MSMSVDGLISGMDTTSLISQLLQAEAGPQLALKKKLATSQTAASAYRTVNTAFAAVRAAAEAALKSDSWTPAKATSSSTKVSVSAGTGAAPGALTFTVAGVASAHSQFRTDPSWTSATAPAGFTTLDVFGADNTTLKGTITVGGSGSLNDAAAAINASAHGLSAAVVQTDTGAYALQVTAKKTGAANKFDLRNAAGSFTTMTTGTNAKLTIGTPPASYAVTSDTNTFASFMPGVTVTVGKDALGTEVTVDVTSDPDAVAAKVQTLIDAANSAIDTVKTYTNNAKGSTAVLKGDFNVSSLAGQLLDAVSFAVGAVASDGSDRSPKTVGLSLGKDGKVAFDKGQFLSALNEDPGLAQRMVAGRAAGTAPDGTAVTAVTGIADRLLGVAKGTSDSATGPLIKMAEAQDAMGKDIQNRIDAWDLRLAKRKEMLTRQFSAMETALSSLKNQSTWLAGQINSLPSYG